MHEGLRSSRFASGRPGPDIRVTRIVQRDAGELFDFLSRLENHFSLSDRSLRLISVHRPRAARAMAYGFVELRGPLRLSRIAVTRVTVLDSPRRLAGTARVGKRSRADIAWTLEPCGSGTLVSLLVTVRLAGPLDRLLLTLGGRTWLRRRLQPVLGRLERDPARVMGLRAAAPS